VHDCAIASRAVELTAIRTKGAIVRRVLSVSIKQFEHKPLQIEGARELGRKIAEALAE